MTYRPMEEERTPLLGPASAISSKVLSEDRGKYTCCTARRKEDINHHQDRQRCLRGTRVYPLIHLIRVDILAHIDTPLTYDQLLAPDSTYTIVRPLTEKYLQMQNQATVFCLLLNKVQFSRDSAQLSISTLSLSRATLCEILAIRVLRGWSERTLPLSMVLLTPWAMFQGAGEEVVERAKEEGDDDILTQGGSALEMAIVSGSKRFIRSPSCQKVIEGIWSGKIIYSAMNTHALIADNYKKRPIQIYNPHKAPLLDHYRLKVPKVRSAMEYLNFLVLFILYVVAIEGLEEDRLNAKELIFIIYALAYSLDKLAAIREHGLRVFSSSLVNGFDFVFMLIYAVYLGSRTYGFHYADADALALGADWLAIGAVLIFPRLAFVTLANNLMVLSIRSMLTEFFFLMGIGIFCFLGFLYALFTLGQGRFELSQIGWWLLEVYFGLDASGFEAAHMFHPFLGPVLMVTYALLSNTLLLTVLVAILGNTFAIINADAAAESMFRKAVSTIEGVKADAVFSYQLPFNLVAVAFMWPMSYILNPRWFHKLNVFMIRMSNFPVLVVISLYERQKYRETTLVESLGDFAERYVGSLPRRLKAAAGFDNFGSRHDISVVFEIEREVGSFYRGWDDDALDEGDPSLPPAAYDETNYPTSDDKVLDGPITTASPIRNMNASQDAPISPQNYSYPHPQSDPQPGPPAPVKSSPRNRHNSMPSAPPSPQAIPTIMRRRRNSSIHEPSPLARLFVRDHDGDDMAAKLRERRQSLMSLAMPASQSQPSLSSILSPLRARQIREGRKSISQLPTIEQGSSTVPDVRPRGIHISRPSIAPIEEGKKLTFTPVTSRQQSPEPGAAGKKGVPFPLGGLGGELGSIGKASDIEGATGGDGAGEMGSGVRERLDAIDDRQKRIEEMLERLLLRSESRRERGRGDVGDQDDNDDVFDDT